MLKLSCFSYKGGAGRTTLAMNIVPFLAEKLGATVKSPLILVDMDIDSCGITYFLHQENCANMRSYSVQALFGYYGSIPKEEMVTDPEEHVMFTHMCAVGEYFKFPAKAILFLPAEPGGALGANNYDGGMPDQLTDFLEECEDVGCCGVLFDSAVGDQLTARWSNAVADKIICCMRPTEQFREGTNRFFEKFDQGTGRDKTVIVVPNVVPTDPMDITVGGRNLHYPDHAKEKIKESFRDNINRGVNEYNMEMLEGASFGVPKVDRFMWHEGILNSIENLTANEREALACYRKLAGIICEND